MRDEKRAIRDAKEIEEREKAGLPPKVLYERIGVDCVDIFAVS